MTACMLPSRRYPEGRTGTAAGYQEHRRAGEDACGACQEAHLLKCRSRYASMSPEQRARRLERNRAEAARYRSESPEKARAAKTRTLDQARSVLRGAKNQPCADCGVSYPYYVMQFDHLGDKEFNIGVAVNRVSRQRLLAEVAKCDVVCANCHAERTHARRYVEIREIA